MELFPKNFNMRTWRTLSAIIFIYAHALRFAVGLHGTQKLHPIVKYEHYQISSGARASLAFVDDYDSRPLTCVYLVIMYTCSLV